MAARYPARMEILPLTPERFPDVAALFEEGGDPKWCWCAYFRFRGRDWTNSTAVENRAALETLTGMPLAPGLVAYEEGRPVGWVSLGPREDYERLAYSKVLAPVDDTPVWSIVCFVVSRRARGKGVVGRAARGRDRLRTRTWRHDPRGVSGRHRRWARACGERLPRHARDVRACRVRGRRAAPVERHEPGPPDRADVARPGRGLIRGRTSMVGPLCPVRASCPAPVGTQQRS